ncbi:MAG: hypothetical protein IPL04_10800 [Chitinophagaceae bacterium]|nr:hypothetical protein [Chitinophagaceae bacterium]
MLYSILKRIARSALPIFCRKIIINKPEILKIKGPVLLACNHPNSFLDSIIIDTLFKEDVWSLARGDAFKKPFLKILAALKYYQCTGQVKVLKIYLKIIKHLMLVLRF